MSIRRPFERRQLFRWEPHGLIVFVECDFLFRGEGAEERVKGDRNGGVFVRHGGQRASDNRLHPEFLQ